MRIGVYTVSESTKRPAIKRVSKSQAHKLVVSGLYAWLTHCAIREVARQAKAKVIQQEARYVIEITPGYDYPEFTKIGENPANRYPVNVGRHRYTTLTNY